MFSLIVQLYLYTEGKIRCFARTAAQWALNEFCASIGANRAWCLELTIIIALSFSTESDKEKFDLIYEKYRNLLLYKAYKILNDTYLAEDAVSDAFLRIYKNLQKISDPLSNQCVAFIVTIVKNTALTIYGKNKRIKNESMDFDDIGTIQDEGFDLEAHVSSNIAAEEIYKCIDGLGEKRRQVFLLKYAYGYSHGEIGKMLGMSEGNVTVTLHRAKKDLMAMIGAKFECR